MSVRGPLRWDRDGAHWPLRAHSRFVEAGGIRWHVQRLGAGPPLLLLHGTGASTHSWQGVAERLAGDFDVIVPDLPGHGFTSAPGAEGFTLRGMARGVRALLRALDVRPRFAAGHSAGAAILIRLHLDHGFPTDHLVSVNGALLPFGFVQRGPLAWAARSLASTRLASRLIAGRVGSPRAVEDIVRSSGSSPPRPSLACYARLAASPDHVHAAIRMMAGWDLLAFGRDLVHVSLPVTLIRADEDAFVPPDDAERVARQLREARVRRLPGLGHLAHEERPDEVAAELRAAFATAGSG
ncbi:MAG: alpha/beta fold hydrolase BchO [Myxococcota bacterium]